MSSGVEFDEDKFNFAPPRAPGMAGVPTYGRPTQMSNVPGMSAWLIKKGIVKTPAAAQMFLIGLVLVNAIITYVALKYFL